ncbi:hypothetical protein V6N11_028134 [Hibiscus sabdariffa]|uniref:RNase H type-1 domain-containing protein n=1 Tax=Hibiscus sabdariffa TaxID=183260 RepID=A0ABR2NZV3_9ROSI
MVPGATTNRFWVFKPQVSFGLYILIRRSLLALILFLANVISSILTEFGQFSGHRVNIRKSQIYFSPNTNPATIAAICSSFSIAQTPTLGKYLGHDRQWDVNRLSVLLLPKAIPFVIGIPPPFEDACDALSWNSTPTVIFSVASAYAHLLEPAWEAIDPKWSWVWSLAVTPRIRMFIWLILKQRLMTNEERCRRGLSSNASCLCCGCVSESIIRILRDYSPTRALWHSIFLRNAKPPSSQLHLNIGSCLISVTSFFPTLLWQLWKRRNDYVFTDTCLPLVAIYKIGLTWAKHFAEINAAARSLAASMVSTSGTWIRGYQKCAGVVSILQAELWSVFVGLQVARSYGVDRLLVQLDSSHTIKLLLDSPQHGHRMPLVRAIRLLCHGAWQVDFQWILRELNMVADCLSKLPSPPQFSLLVTTVVPEPARPFPDRDREGPPYSRHSAESLESCRSFVCLPSYLNAYSVFRLSCALFFPT